MAELSLRMFQVLAQLSMASDSMTAAQIGMAIDPNVSRRRAATIVNASVAALERGGLVTREMRPFGGVGYVISEEGKARLVSKSPMVRRDAARMPRTFDQYSKKRRWQLLRKAEGRCVKCGRQNPDLSHEMCPECLIVTRRRRRLTYTRAPNSMQYHHCGRCGRHGHNRRTCEEEVRDAE